MYLFTFGINHQTAPLTVREQVAFHAERVAQALRDLVDCRPVKEAAILSTCNRTEIYCNTDQPAAAVDWLAQYHHLPPDGLEPYLYRLPQMWADFDPQKKRFVQKPQLPPEFLPPPANKNGSTASKPAAERNGTGKKAKPADAIEEEGEPNLVPLDEEEQAVAAAPEETAPTDDDAGTMTALAAAPAEPAGEGGGDGLLDMFSTVGIQTQDRSALLNLAGEVEMADLVSELGLVAAALGLVKGQQAAVEAVEEDEALAA